MSPTPQSLRAARANRVHHADQIAAILRDRFPELSALRGRLCDVAGQSPEAFREALAELSEADAAVTALAVSLAFNHVCQTSLELQIEALDSE